MPSRRDQAATQVLTGLMQDDYPLTLQHVLRRARSVYRASDVRTLTQAGVVRARFGELAQRVDQLSAALSGLGVRPGDRVGTLAWNTQPHLELYLSVPCTGAVLHTLNLRLSPQQLAYVIGHADDQVVFVEDDLVPLLEPVLGQLSCVRQWVVIGDGDTGALDPVIRYEELLAGAPRGYQYPELDERQAATLCYTSGTTGNPKGVLYSHRSSLLHALGSLGADSLGLSCADRAMPVVPMFHVNAWGIPYAALLTGADLVLPGRFVMPQAIAQLIETQGVTLSAAVPTVWWDLLQYADGHRPDLSGLRMLLCGGAAVPLALMQAFEQRHGVNVVQAWGLTETSPVGSVAIPPAGAAGEEHWRCRGRAGRIVPLVEARVTGDSGRELPWDDEAVGEIELSGPWIASGYYRQNDLDGKFRGRWFRTGDIGSIDEHGFVRITDRSKDVIKSGGEWISSLALESALTEHPAVAEAAVIARPDERWTERPLACVVLAGGASASPEELRAHLAVRVPRWWLPDEFAYIAQVPKTSTGKFDKKLLRERLRTGYLTGGEAAPSATPPGGEAAPSPARPGGDGGEG
jgi:fatty-acyl-CoA synthase